MENKKVIASRLVWLMAFWVVAFGSSHAAVTIRNGFEPPVLTPGPFGQDPNRLPARDPLWSLMAQGHGVDLVNLARVETFLVRAGTQAIQINAAAAGKIQSGISTSFENREPYLRVELDFRLQSSSSPTNWQISVGDNEAPGGFVAGINVAGDNGRLQFMTNGFPESAPLIKRDTWTHCALALDLKTQTYDVLIDGKVVRARIPFLAKAERVRVFQFDTFASGNDSAFLDNFSVDSAPLGVAATPASIASLSAPRATPAPALPAGGLAIQLANPWDRPAALSAGGHSQEIDDLRRLLSPRGKASTEVHPGTARGLFDGVDYLQPMAAAVAALKPANSMAITSKIACGGFPDGLSFRSFDGKWEGVYNRLFMVLDTAGQVAALEFVSESTAYVPPFIQKAPEPGPWHLIDIVQARVKGRQGIPITMRVVEVGDRVIVNTVSERHTATLYMNKNLVNLILHCCESQSARSKGGL